MHWRALGLIILLEIHSGVHAGDLIAVAVEHQRVAAEDFAETALLSLAPAVSYTHLDVYKRQVFRISALSVFAMFFLVLLFFREPKRAENEPAPSVSRPLRNFLVVLSNPKFMLFLLIFTGYWVVFWQQYITLPGYVHRYIDANASVEWILMTDSLSVIALTLLVNYLTRSIPAFHAIIIGTLITSRCV